jgi:hypothetical protein
VAADCAGRLLDLPRRVALHLRENHEGGLKAPAALAIATVSSAELLSNTYILALRNGTCFIEAGNYHRNFARSFQHGIHDTRVYLPDNLVLSEYANSNRLMTGEI